MLTLVVARARNGAIGKDNDIPWHSPEDLKMFQRETTSGAIIMGRLTWDSLPVRPLKNRMNIVVSRNPDLAEHVCTSVAQAVQMGYDAGYQRLYGIGGQSIYRDMLPIADRLLITEVDLEVEAADAFFPEFDEGEWVEISRRELSAGPPRCVLRELVRGEIT
ncbi:Dihydrofolate reductase [Roseovarius litorisediminis]|uniref:Dihydrofolate reductase n=1 Tax=Roseovarius litorisediminis TaxID=1312363 RepID=A0A1Y5T0Z7_9RHOB|nr:dihydrofolate reductase [Roseovarius litorisediminis]SLN52842.1 Dihydrofolate reductase [Roseovarius litorisediminis]